MSQSQFLTTQQLHDRAAELYGPSLDSVRRYAIAWIHQARLARGLAREYAAVRLGGVAEGVAGALWSRHKRPEAMRLAARLRRVADRLQEIARPEREREISQKIDEWLESPRSTGAEHVAAYVRAHRTGSRA